MKKLFLLVGLLLSFIRIAGADGIFSGGFSTVASTSNLPADVALTDANNSFTGTNTFNTSSMTINNLLLVSTGSVSTTATAIASRSGSATAFNCLSMGRTGRDYYMCVVGATGNFFTSTGAGDVVLADTNAGSEISIGIGTGGSLPALRIYTSSQTVNGTLIVTSTATWTGVTFATLGTPSNGTIEYCQDCTVTTPTTCTTNVLSSCVCAGSGAGAFAKRLNATWYCN